MGCGFFMQSGHCVNGDACTYAHSYEELRPMPPMMMNHMIGMPSGHMMMNHPMAMMGQHAMMSQHPIPKMGAAGGHARTNAKDKDKRVREKETHDKKHEKKRKERKELKRRKGRSRRRRSRSKR